MARKRPRGKRPTPKASRDDEEESTTMEESAAEGDVENELNNDDAQSKQNAESDIQEVTPAPESESQSEDHNMGEDQPTAGDGDNAVQDSRTRRGRKRKADIPEEERFTPTTDPAKRGIIAQGGSLRRRDTLKTTTRYSPPPVSSRPKTKLSLDATAAPRSIIDADLSVEASSKKPLEISTSSVNKRKIAVSARSVASNVISGSTETIEKTIEEVDEATPVKSVEAEEPMDAEAPVDSVSSSEKIVTEKSEESLKQPATRNSRRKSDNTAVSNTTPTSSVISTSSTSITNANTATETVVSTPSTTVVATNKVTTTKTVFTTVKLTNSGPTNTKEAALVLAGKVGQVSQANTLKPMPAILKTSTPSVSSTTVSQTVGAKVQSVSRRPAPPLNKYVETLPPITDCIKEDGDDSNIQKLPDRILLVHSELPLHLAVYIDHSDKDYLFRQIISPVQSNKYTCLLCKGIDVNYATKEEKDMLLHYQSLHELDVDIGNAKFSEEIVFICLPKMVLNQLNQTHSITLNSGCQYCDARLGDITDMKEHYAKEHQKEVVLMEQEQIMKMHHYFYCPKCRFESSDFEIHHKHMRTEHKLTTYKCKNCVLVTRDENRMRMHFKAKHMLHTQGQNYQCFYCRGLLVGQERLLKHITQSHMVLTSSEGYSCIACRISVGRGKDLTQHAQNCALAGFKPESRDHVRFIVPAAENTPLPEGQVECYFCKVRLSNEHYYQLHLHHEHMIWTKDSIVKQVADSVEPRETLTINDVISDEDMEKAKIQTYVGHWCRLCDQLIKVYQLYYLHMHNTHNMKKVFQCVITECKAQFDSFDEFKAHIDDTKHSQMTIISNPDEVFVCNYCDIYFSKEEELIKHLVTDEHINKFTSSGHFHRTEPRNYKCKACHTFFGMKESYIHHLETEAHKYSCAYCNITTATANARRAHVQNTHPEKLQLCEECDQPVHIDIMAHFVEHGFTFECKKCVKKFYNRERLNAHMEVHQDPIECQWENCDRMIATRSMLVTHYRTHKSEHKCQICGQAFWNFSMLTSHLRSHQTQPRTGQPVTSKRPVISVQHRPSHTVTATRATSVAEDTKIKCGHCNLQFRGRDLPNHKCVPVSTVSKVPETTNTKATSQAKSRSRRRVPSARVVGSLSDSNAHMNTNNMDGDTEGGTQLIMILNQMSGELMEITAPTGMEVNEVIRSLNIQGIDAVAAPPDAVQQIKMAQNERQSTLRTTAGQSNQSINSQIIKLEPSDQDENELSSVEIITQAEDGTTQVVTAEDLQNFQQVSTDDDGNQVIIEQVEKDGVTNIIAHTIDTGEGSQSIIIPQELIGPDGSVTLDEETIARFNLQFAVDQNGESNGTFIINSEE